MFMRLVQAKYDPAALTVIRQVYENKIIPQLQQMKGCLFACLIKSEMDVDEGLSMTLWDTQENAESYVYSGMFQVLVDEIKPYLQVSTEWKMQLSKDIKLEYKPVAEEPVISSHQTLAQLDNALPVEIMYLRLLSLKIQPGKMDEFVRIYQQEILPQLKNVAGCRYAYLSTSGEDKNEAISITIWNSKQAVEHYEDSGVFKNLMDKARHTYSELYQWKIALENDRSGHIVTSEDPSLKYYSIISGKSFGK
jgi:heme-degrading monooxygenase HmoA